MTAPRVPVLLYDGECSLCNATVRFLLRRDPGGRLHFAALQSAPAQEYLASQGLPADDLESLVFVPDWDARPRVKPLLRTSGALAAFAELGGRWRSVSRLRFIPTPLRDAVYRCVARSRYVLFGRYTPTPLPDPTWNQRFLDR